MRERAQPPSRTLSSPVRSRKPWFPLVLSGKSRVKKRQCGLTLGLSTGRCGGGWGVPKCQPEQVKSRLRPWGGAADGAGGVHVSGEGQGCFISLVHAGCW